ncbi:MAG TPA: M28 family peptidase [Ferruginibacter sp.]|nr:M28 family peptidase [Ferruginibacter sp.]
MPLYAFTNSERCNFRNGKIVMGLLATFAVQNLIEMKICMLFFLLWCQDAFGQQNKEDIDMLSSLKKNIIYLADDKLEGRRTGSAGEKLAYEFISSTFKKAGLAPAGDNKTYIQAFDVYEGKEISPRTSFSVNGKAASVMKEFFPLSYSANGRKNFRDVSFNNNNNVRFIDLKDIITQNKNNPHFDLPDYLLTFSKDAEKNEALAVIIFNSSDTSDNIKYDGKAKIPALNIPVIYISKQAKEKYFNGNSKYNISINIDTHEKQRKGHNVVGFINNQAAATIILGAHYDHLGYGEDHNTLYAGAIPMIHNGADDNASGTAALIGISKWVKHSGLKNYNYLFIAFSGEELGLYGSKYFTEHSPVPLSSVNYMINMDMIGRVNDSTHGLTIGGYGTSPYWGELFSTNDGYFRIKIDSSGTGPSDHTSFYKKDIPVLFFFSGTHSDYHKPSDDAEKINFNGAVQVINLIKKIITTTNSKEKLAFTKTKEATMGRSGFKVSLGIMPDYTFSGAGVLVDGVSEGKAAQKAGIKTGDVLIQLGDHPFSDVQTYMETLNKFNKGESTVVKLKRGKEEIVLPVVF